MTTSAASTTSALRVLVVDDHELTRWALKIALGRQPHIAEVAVASNGKEALELIATQLPHLVVLDLHMPVMDGWQASQHIKQAFPDIKIIAYSAVEGGEATARHLGAAVDGFCEKGACIQSLLQAIAAVM